MRELVRSPEEIRKAFHEATHAAVAICLEIPLDFVTMEPEIVNGERVEGFCQFTNLWMHELARTPDQLLSRFAKAMLAGRVCDELILGADVSEKIRGSWEGDSSTLYRVANDLRSFLTFGDYKNWLDQMLSETHGIVAERDFNDRVLSIAERLLEKGRISGEEALQAYLAPRPNALPAKNEGA